MQYFGEKMHKTKVFCIKGEKNTLLAQVLAKIKVLNQ